MEGTQARLYERSSKNPTYRLYELTLIGLLLFSAAIKQQIFILKNCTVYINSVRVTLWLEI